jgi:hypothetical protein
MPELKDQDSENDSAVLALPYRMLNSEESKSEKLLLEGGSVQQ